MPSFTKDAIKQSFLKLLNVKPYNKITVKDIVEDCGINRNSFYYHFSDLPALVEEILLDDTNMILEQNTNFTSLYDCILVAISFALKNKKAVLHLYNSANRETFEAYLNKLCEYAVKSLFDNACQGVPVNQDDKELMVLYYKCQLMGFVLDWFGQEMNYDLCSKIHRLCELFDGALENAVKRSVEDNQTK